MILGRANFRKKIGTAPGTLTYTGEADQRAIQISLLQYNSTSLEEDKYSDISQVIEKYNPEHVNWIDVDGIHNTKTIEALGKHYQIHPLVLEDILSTENRPKVEAYDNYIFFTAAMLYITKENELKKEQISLILGNNYVISFQQFPGDVFEGVRNRIRKSIGRIRKSGADYLVYALLDTIVDHYYFIEEKVQIELDNIESNVYNQEYSDRGFMQKIQYLRKDIIQLRKAVSPLKEAVLNLKKETNPLVTKTTSKFLADLLDHILFINDAVEVFRENLNGLTDLYHSFQSSRLNEVMKVLTVISTIFIPLSFLAGLYGMNFTNMPELEYENGYYILLAVMSLIVLIMIYYFRRKKWL